MMDHRAGAAEPHSPAALDALAASIDERAPPPRVREALAAAQSGLEARFRRGEPVTALVETRSRLVDRVLVLAWRRFGLDDHVRHALVAVGGYGRG